MKILVSIDQKAAFAAGMDAPDSTAWVDIDPTTLAAPIREEITKVVGMCNKAESIRVLTPTVESVVAWAQDRIDADKADQAKRAEREQDLRQKLENPEMVEVVIVCDYYGNIHRRPGGAATGDAVASTTVKEHRIPFVSHKDSDDLKQLERALEERKRAVFASAKASLKSQYEEWVEEQDARVAAEQQERIKVNEQRTAALNRFIEQHGTEGQRKRLYRGLLPESEVERCASSHYLQPVIDQYGRFSAPTKRDFYDMFDATCDVEAVDRIASECDDSDIQALETVEAFVRDLDPDGQVKLREHILRRGDFEDEKEEIISLYISISATVDEVPIRALLSTMSVDDAAKIAEGFSAE